MKYKTLGIISDCVHMFDVNGKPATENYIFKKQMESLASKFERTIICCPFITYSSQQITSTYTNCTIEFMPLPNVGGDSISDKLQLLKTIPQWLKAFKKIARSVDIIYQRFPNNLNIPGFFYFYFKKTKTFATYTGTWQNYKGEPATYRFQKWLLKNYFRGPVFVYTTDKTSGKFFRTFSPSYSFQDWESETAQVENKIQKAKIQQNYLSVFITVGSLVSNKNQQYILDVFKILHQENFAFKLYVVGDGPLKGLFNQFIQINQLNNRVFLTGKISHKELRELYREADFLVQAPLAEGFGKAPIEGFFHGVIPILNDVAVAKEMTGNNERGYLFSVAKVTNLVNLIQSLNENKNVFPAMIQSGRNYAKSHTLENWTDNFVEILTQYFD